MKYSVVWSELKYIENSLNLWTIMEGVINLGNTTDKFKLRPSLKYYWLGIFCLRP